MGSGTGEGRAAKPRPALLVTWLLLPEPKGVSLADISEPMTPASAAALPVAESRGTRPPAA